MIKITAETIIYKTSEDRNFNQRSTLLHWKTLSNAWNYRLKPFKKDIDPTFTDQNSYNSTWRSLLEKGKDACKALPKCLWTVPKSVENFIKIATLFL